MASAIGAYATLVNAKARLKITDNTDDAFLQQACDGVNGFIESKTGRVLAPVPAIATTVSSGATLGSTAVTLGSGTGIAAGDALLFGPVSGAHEHGIVVGVAGAVVTLQWGLAAAYANGTAVSRCILFDGAEALEGGLLLPVSSGIVSASSLEVAFYTGASFNLIPATDWFLRPLPIDRDPGWPATELWMSDVPSSGNACPTFQRGLGNVRLGGVIPGWPAIPDEISTLAYNVVATLYRRRGVGGGGDSVMIGSDGARTISLLLDANDWRTLNRYTSNEVVII